MGFAGKCRNDSRLRAGTAAVAYLVGDLEIIPPFHRACEQPSPDLPTVIALIRDYSQLRLRGGIALVLPFVILGCGPRAEPDATVRIELSGRTVALEPTELGPALKMSASITNSSNQLVLMSTCEYVLYQYRYTLVTGTSDDWVEVWRPSCTSQNSLAFTPIGPGKTIFVPITVVATPALAPDFSAEPGRYRFRFFLSIRLGEEYRQLPAERSVSEPFTLLAQ